MKLLGQVSFGPDAVALASLNLAEHEYQRWGEIDFFLVLPDGLIAIEVKGGDVDCIDGVWRFTDSRGRVIKKNISPIAQAQAGFSSLVKKYITPQFPGVLNRVPAGFCALFPGAERKSVAGIIGGPEMPAELVGTMEDCKNAAALRNFLDRVLAYWKAKLKAPAQNIGSAQIRQIVSALRPSFDRVPPLSIALKRVRNEQFALTSDQYRLLDYLETAPRILCTGAAGTGKTFIAMECLRRERNNSPIFVTGTEKIAAHLRACEPQLASRIFSFHELQEGALPLPNVVNTLIVDEGQQITHSDSIRLFSKILGRPMSHAKWRWFSDPNHQVSSTSLFDQSIQNDLLEWSNQVHPTLPDNCRNTPEIVRAVEFLTGAEIGRTRTKGKGPEVEYAQAIALDALVNETAKKINHWIEADEIPPGEILLLTGRKIGNSSIPSIAAAAGLAYKEWHAGWDTGRDYPRMIAVSSIEDFRGLESPFVILCDLDGNLSDVERSLYLGITRANFGVFLACLATQSQSIATERLLGLR